MSFALTGFMLYAMWAVLGVMLIDFAAASYRALKNSSFSSALIVDYLKALLYNVFPLFLLSNMLPLDPTGWILLIAYYVGGLAVFLNYLSAIKSKF